MVSLVEIPTNISSMMTTPLVFYVYIFPYQTWENVLNNIVGSNCLPSLIQSFNMAINVSF
jgi:hypothetical protein